MEIKKDRISGMANFQHKQLAAGRWSKLSFAEQMANIGSEVERTILWRNKNRGYSSMAFERALELLDLTVENEAKSKFRLKEILRLREALVDYFLFNNQFASSDQLWRNYFHPFNFAARRDY